MVCDRQSCFMPSRVWRRGRFMVGVFILSELAAMVVAQPVTAADDDSDGFKLENVPAATKVLVGIRPSRLALRPELEQFVKLFEETSGDRQGGWKVKDVDQVLMIFVPSLDDVGGGDPIGTPVVEIRLTKPTDLETWIKRVLGDDISLQDAGDDVVWANSNRELTPHSQVAYAVNSRTFLLGDSANVLNVVRARQKRDEQPVWSEEFSQVAGDDVCAVVNMAYYRPILQGVFAADPNPLLGMFVPLWENTDLVIAGGRIDDQLSLDVHALSKNAQAATKVEERMKALIPLAQGLLESSRISIDQTQDEMRPLLEQAADAAEVALEKLVIETVEDAVTLSVKSETDSLATIAKALLPSVKEAREAARRTQSRNNLKQIALAFHNYHDVNGHFPPPVLLGPDGKTKYSWRVAVLPYLDEAALYNAYDFSEPWDSENNRKILAQMPAVFRHPNDKAGSTNTSYFILAGEVTAVGNQDGEGVGIREITDGTSNTLLTVEAKRDIPWTKPVDLPYDPDKDVPKLGGFFTGGYHVGLADGSVRFINEKIDLGLLRSLITKDGGEVIDRQGF